jgi:hypothetical protein
VGIFARPHVEFAVDFMHKRVSSAAEEKSFLSIYSKLSNLEKVRGINLLLHASALAPKTSRTSI